MLFTEKELLAFKTFNGTLDEFKEGIKQITNEPDKVISVICECLEIDSDQLNIDTRKREIAFQRQIAHWGLYYYTYMSIAKIGRKVGNRDHTTVLHSKKLINDLIESDKGVKQTISEIEQKLSEAEIVRKFSIDDIRVGRW